MSECLLVKLDLPVALRATVLETKVATNLVFHVERR